MLPADLGFVYLCVFAGLLVLVFVIPLLTAGLLYLCAGFVVEPEGFLLVLFLLKLFEELTAGFLYEYLCLVALAGFCLGVVLVLELVAIIAPDVPAVPLIAGFILLPFDLLRPPVLLLAVLLLVPELRVAVPLNDLGLLAKYSLLDEEELDA